MFACRLVSDKDRFFNHCRGEVNDAEDGGS